MDIGDGFAYEFFQWAPDRELNPQYIGIPDVERAGIHLLKDGVSIGTCWFDTPEVRAIPSTKTMWQLVSLAPLHIEPSIQTYKYVDGQHVPEYHGYIRQDRWVSV